MKGTRKTLTGRVVSNKMSKTVVVEVTWLQRHPLYRKASRRITKAYAHDEGGRCTVGDVVRLEETRPLSRLKRWRVVEILQRHEQPEVSPAALDQSVLEQIAAGSPRTPEAPASPEEDPSLQGPQEKGQEP